ncbi:MAG: PhzF family phenazine biosynthesis protein [Geminicoccaceae bacterium]
MRLRFHTVDVFTDRRFGGNPLAVLPDAQGLDTAAMQAIAAEFNLSETTFVLPPEDPAHTARVRIFTPRAEVPFAGHPTVGTALVLANEDRVRAGQSVTFEMAAGIVPVQLQWRGNRATHAELTAPAAPRRGMAVDPEPVAAALGIGVADLVTAGGLPCDVSAGLPFLFAEVRNRDVLGRSRCTSALDLSPGAREGLYVFARVGDTEIAGRMFAPAHGIPEDPATGSAAAALAGLLAEGAGEGLHRRTIMQGVEMGRPSRIETVAVVRDGKVVASRVGGQAVPVMTGEIDLG